MKSIIERKLEMLRTLNKVFDQYVADKYKMACSRSCAVCCTHNTTATTLEALAMLRVLKQTGRGDLAEKLEDTAGRELFRPKITTNTLAMACLSGMDAPVEAPGENPGPCPWLEDGLCAAYEVRPFSCRGMFSLTRCRPGIEAEMPPELVSIVTVCWQILEHLDAGGLYGNLIDLMFNLSQNNQTAKYEQGERLTARGLPPTRPVPGFLVPPEEQAAINDFLNELFSADCGGQTFRERMASVRESPF